MDSNALTSQQLMVYAVAFGAATGLLLGLIPLILGLKRGERRLGIIGFAASLIGGAVVGLLASIPMVIIFTWIIVRKARERSSKEEFHR